MDTQKNDLEFENINKIYDECLNYLQNVNSDANSDIKTRYLDEENDHLYETIEEVNKKVPQKHFEEYSKANKTVDKHPMVELNFENEASNESLTSVSESKSGRLRRLSAQLPKIIITQSNTSLNVKKEEKLRNYTDFKEGLKKSDAYDYVSYKKILNMETMKRPEPPLRYKAYCDFPKRLVSKSGMENVALISNVPFERIRLLNDTFHTLINLRWRWIVIGTIAVHFTLWLVFAIFWYITALAHYDFEPEPPQRTCVTGGKDFVTIFLASVEAQTTIGFGDRAIDEECPESIFLFIMQLILGTGLSGVLTCIVYAKLTRPEKMTRNGVGFSKKAVICLRDGRLCFMIRAWDFNYDHIISSEFCAHFINTYRTKEGEVLRYHAKILPLRQRQFLLWPVTLVHEINEASPLYKITPKNINEYSFEITISLKGASASMSTFTQSQTSYLPREIVWGHRFLPVVKYDSRKQKYVIDNLKLDTMEPVDTPYCSAYELYSSKYTPEKLEVPGTPSNFSEKMSTFHIGRQSSFRRREKT